MKILYVIASLRGGAAEHLLYLLEYFQQQGHTLFLAAPDDCPETSSKLNLDAVHWMKIPMDRRFSFAPTRQLALVLTQEKIDLIHCHGIRAGYYGRRALAKARKKDCSAKLIYTIHGFHPAYYTNPLIRKITLSLEKRLFLSRTDHVIFVSESDRTLFSQLLGLNRDLLRQRSSLIPNGIRYFCPEQLPDKKQARSSLGINENAFVIGTLSRLNRQKAVHLILEAASQLRSDLPNLQVLIAGDGPLHGKLESLAEKLRIRDRIHFLGYTGDILTFYSAIDCFVLSSLWEGLPLVLLEAGGLGLPIVASRVSGTLEAIEEGKTGLLFESENSEDFSQCLLQIHANPDLAREIGNAARKKIPQAFSLEKMLEETQKVYQFLLKQS